jgi:vacuolar protein sorting-associated protein 13D
MAEWSRGFELTSGGQALRVALTNVVEPDHVYNVGVEVRQGTGRYKNTQVVLLTPRYRINNQSSHRLYLAKREDIYVSRGLYDMVHS